MPPSPSPQPPRPSVRARAAGAALAVLSLALPALLARPAAAQPADVPPLETIAAVVADADGDHLPDRLDALVRVRGVLVSPPGSARQNGLTVAALADDAAGLMLVDPGLALVGLRPGDDVEVTGRVTSFYGVEQIVVERMAVVGRRPVPPPLDVRPSAVQGEALAGRLVRVRGRLVTRPDEGVRRGFSVAVGAERVQLYVPEAVGQSPDFALSMADDGRTVEVTAFAGQFDRTPPFDEGYQLILLTPDAVVRSGLARPALVRWGTLGAVAALLLALLAYRRHAAGLRRQSTTDPMTGLLNRRGLEEALDTAVAEAREAGRPVALLLLDLDDFKAANDRYGHLVGDAVLRAAADVLRAALRGGPGLACRYGGDEFVVLLPGAERPRATAVAEALVAALRTVTVRGPDGPLELRLGASVGVSAVRGDDAAGEALLRDADAALYQSKRAGKGQARLALHAG